MFILLFCLFGNTHNSVLIALIAIFKFINTQKQNIKVNIGNKANIINSMMSFTSVYLLTDIITTKATMILYPIRYSNLNSLIHVKCSCFLCNCTTNSFTIKLIFDNSIKFLFKYIIGNPFNK